MGLDSGIFNIILLITATWNLCPSVLLITPKHVWYRQVQYPACFFICYYTLTQSNTAVYSALADSPQLYSPICASCCLPAFSDLMHLACKN